MSSTYHNTNRETTILINPLLTPQHNCRPSNPLTTENDSSMNKKNNRQDVVAAKADHLSLYLKYGIAKHRGV